MASTTDDALREQIRRLLADGAPNPPPTPQALSQDAVDAIVRALREMGADDLAGKLGVGGFTLQPHVLADDPDGLEHACRTCMYYERHRRFCNLPELMLPVEPAWSCAVWRV